MNVAACRKRELLGIWKQSRIKEDKEYSSYGYGSESSRGGGG